MPITLSPLTRSEIPTFVEIELEAFRNHPRIPMLWRSGYTDDVKAFYRANKEKTLDDPDGRIMKAVDDETGRIVAVSEWAFALDPVKQAEKDPVDPDGAPPSNWPLDGNWELRRFFALNLEKWERESLSGKPYIKLEYLVTHPDFHGRGAGTKLLSWGVNEADKNGVMMCLEATAAGLSLYKRFGFKAVDEIRADMRQFGWHKPYDDEAASRVWMIRDARSQ